MVEYGREAAQAQTRPELNEPMSRSASIKPFSPKAKQLGTIFR